MTTFVDVYHSVSAALKDSKLVSAARSAAFERHFAQAKGCNLYRGIYASFSEAIAAAPGTKPIGYDHPGPASMYRERLGQLYSEDYPILHWLRELLPTTRRVFDLGGHVGLGYYAYRRYLPFDDSLRWTVCDVPKVAEAGRELQASEGAEALLFTSDVSDADGADVLFSAGALQYIERPFASQLLDLESPPSHLLLNLLPVVSGKGFVTLQNMGEAFCPYQVFSREELVSSLLELGYELRDEWDNPGKQCYISTHPGRSVNGYSGFYFAKPASATTGVSKSEAS